MRVSAPREARLARLLKKKRKEKQTTYNKHLGEGRKRWCLFPFPGGSTGPLASQATEDVLASRSYIKVKIIAILLPDVHSPAPSPREESRPTLRLEHYPPTSLPKGAAGGDPETGAWAAGPPAIPGTVTSMRHPHL